MTIQEKSITVAEFVGMIKSKFGEWSFKEDYKEVEGNQTSIQWHRTLLFAGDYSWLMYAWHKVRKLDFDNERDENTFANAVKLIELAVMHYDITEAFEKIYNVIKWYNSTNPQPLPNE